MLNNIRNDPQLAQRIGDENTLSKLQRGERLSGDEGIQRFLMEANRVTELHTICQNNLECALEPVVIGLKLTDAYRATLAKSLQAENFQAAYSQLEKIKDWASFDEKSRSSLKMYEDYIHGAIDAPEALQFDDEQLSILIRSGCPVSAHMKLEELAERLSGEESDQLNLEDVGILAAAFS